MMVARKVRASSKELASRKRAVRCRTAWMKAALSGHPFGAKNRRWTCSGCAIACVGNPAAASRKTALEAAAAIAPMGRQTHMDNLSHLSPLGVNRRPRPASRGQIFARGNRPSPGSLCEPTSPRVAGRGGFRQKPE